MNDDLIGWAEDLAPRVEALAAEIEVRRSLPEVLLEELFAQDVFRALVPRALGGQERELGSPRWPSGLRVARLTMRWCSPVAKLPASTARR